MIASQYEAFLNSKAILQPASGIKVSSVNDKLFPFQQVITKWALRRGKAAIFAGCGLGKSCMQLEWANQIVRHTNKSVLLLAPLAVSAQTQREGAKFGIEAHLVRSMKQVNGASIYITNYEILNHFDTAHFVGAVLDESSCIKAHDSKTRAEITESFRKTPYRLACTATPAPNDYMELANHAEFMGAMTRAEMLSMFFIHDSGETQKWRLKGHAEAEFWKWICTWAVMIQKPSDLGFDDGGFDLPPIEYHSHVVDANHDAAKKMGLLFAMEARTMDERRAARKGSLEDRCELTAEMVNASRDQWGLWCNLNAEGDLLEKLIPDAVQVSGSDSMDDKESKLMGFIDGRHRVLVSKPSIAGFGLNLQMCHELAFVGLSDSFEEMYQAIRRFWRFGQQHQVNCHIVTGELEGAVVANIRRKEADAERMSAEMIKHMDKIQRAEVGGLERQEAEYIRAVESSDQWTLHLGDCVEVAREVESGSIDYSIYSPPFNSLYTYSNSLRDMGNCKRGNEFMQHFAFLVEELFRVTKPGRLMSFHCMNLPTSKAHDGYIGIRDFRGELIELFQQAGWIYHSEVVIWKDPVTAMQRTKALGLLYKQLRKDSAMSRQGIPDYLVIMRKPGENPDPVTKTHESFPVQLWQNYASPVWMDIDQSDTLEFRSARENEDERHICALQLGVIDRAIRLWTNPNDLVLSPFAGIGSEGYMAVKLGRRFVGIELKRSYWDRAVKHLREAEKSQGGLFGQDHEALTI